MSRCLVGFTVTCIGIDRPIVDLKDEQTKKPPHQEVTRTATGHPDLHVFYGALEKMV